MSTEKCMNKGYTTKLDNGLMHVWFNTLPNGATFLHRGEFYIKIADERATEILKNIVWVFEGHYGCLISMQQFEEYDVSEKSVRPIIRCV